MSPVDDILKQLPINDLAARLGVDPGTAEQAARQAVPALLGGMQANSSDPAGEASLASAVQQHDAGLIEGGVDLAKVDTADGNAIVSNVFGEQRDAVINQLGATGQQAGGGSDLIGKILPILAPIVMAYLAKRFMGGGSAATAGAPAGQAPAAGTAPGGGIGDLLGGLLGGQGQPGAAAGGSINDILGGLLGGGRR